MDEDEHAQKELNRSDQFAAMDHGLADSVQNISINDQPVKTDKQRVNACTQPVNNYDERVKAFNQRAHTCKQAVLNGTELPKPRPAVFKSHSQREKERLEVVQAWKDYIGAGGFEDWVRLCHDLRLEGDFSTKAKCKAALAKLWVNICDFLKIREEVAFFATEEELSVYSIRTGKIYPRDRIKSGDPLESLLAGIYNPHRERVKTANGGSKVPPIAACRTWPLDDKHWIVKSDVTKGN